MDNFKATIRESSKQLTAREKLKYMDTQLSTNLSEVTDEIIITPDFYVVVDVHNENSEDKDYVQYHVIDKDGTDYYTGSESFWRAFKTIFDTMLGEEEDYQIRVFQRESANYKGKYFISCAIV